MYLMNFMNIQMQKEQINKLDNTSFFKSDDESVYSNKNEKKIKKLKKHLTKEEVFGNIDEHC